MIFNARQFGFFSLLLVIFLSTTDLKAKSIEPTIIFKGNRVQSMDTLWEVVHISKTARASKSMATVIRHRLNRWYRKKGYELAKIQTRLHEGKILVLIDEGRLEKVIILGKDPVWTSLLQFTIHFPHDVFNRNLLKEQLQKIKKDYEIDNIDAKLVPSKIVEHNDWQLSDIGFGIFGDTAKYDLVITVESERGEGAGIGIGIVSPYGVVPKITYTDYHLMFKEEDRLKLYLQTGYWIRTSQNSGETELAFTHVGAGARYDFPAIANLVRFYFTADSALSIFQRTDLPVDSYWDFSNKGSFNIGFDILKGMEVYTGITAEYKSVFSDVPVFTGDDAKPIREMAGRSQNDPKYAAYSGLFDISAISPVKFETNPFNKLRAILVAGFYYDWTKDELRSDRHNTVSFEFKPHLVDFSKGVDRFYRFDLKYKQLFPYGYHDLVLKLRTIATINETEYFDEEPLSGSYLRTFYTNTYYVDQAQYISLEFRLSIWKDIIKLSAFHDFAVFGEIDHGTGFNDSETLSFGWANSFGPGFHWLIINTFQFNFYGAVGFANDDFAWTPYFTFSKVY